METARSQRAIFGRCSVGHRLRHLDRCAEEEGLTLPLLLLLLLLSLLLVLLLLALLLLLLPLLPVRLLLLLFPLLSCS